LRKSIPINVLKCVIGVGLISYLLWANWGTLKPIWQKHFVEGAPINYAPFALAILVCLGSILLTFVRWYFLVRALDLPFTIGDAIRLGFYGYATSPFLPSSIGGDIVKAAFIARGQSRRTAAVATVVVDRIVGLWGLFWLVTILGGVFWWNGQLTGEVGDKLKIIVLSAAGVCAASVIVWLLLGILPTHRAHRFAGRLEKIPGAGHALAELWRAAWMYRSKGRTIALTLAMSLVGHLGFVSLFYLSAQTLVPRKDIPSLATHFLIIPIGMAFQAGFPAPGGLGGGELAFVELYKLVNYPAEYGLLGSIVQRIVTWILAAVGYLYVCVRPAGARNLATETAEQVQASVNGIHNAAPEQGKSHSHHSSIRDP
jgi:uncharacterized membrane protein YbhN (UPF0104 family)